MTLKYWRYERFERFSLLTYSFSCCDFILYAIYQHRFCDQLKYNFCTFFELLSFEYILFPNKILITNTKPVKITANTNRFSSFFPFSDWIGSLRVVSGLLNQRSKLMTNNENKRDFINQQLHQNNQVRCVSMRKCKRFHLLVKLSHLSIGQNSLKYRLDMAYLIVLCTEFLSIDTWTTLQEDTDI